MDEHRKEKLTNIRTTALIWVFWFCIGYGSYGIIVFMPTFLQQKGISMGNTFLSVFVSSCALLASFLVVFLLINRVKRYDLTPFFLTFLSKLLLGFFLFLGSISILLFAFSDSFSSMLVYNSLFNFFVESGWVTLYVYTPEVYPTHIRASGKVRLCITSLGMGTASALAKLAGIISPFLSAQLMSIALYIFAAFFIVASVAGFCLPIETMNRKLEDWAVQ